MAHVDHDGAEGRGFLNSGLDRGCQIATDKDRGAPGRVGGTLQRPDHIGGRGGVVRIIGLTGLSLGLIGDQRQNDDRQEFPHGERVQGSDSA